MHQDFGTKFSLIKLKECELENINIISFLFKTWKNFYIGFVDLSLDISLAPYDR